MNTKEERDFVEHVVKTMEDETSRLQGKGYDPTSRVTALKEKSATATAAEVAQQKAQSEAMNATKIANEALKAAYDDASSVIDLMEGLFGKDDALVHKLRKFRNW
ncbi:MAG: hypothetical protein ACK5JD_04805 [Mangrovibacterium sp.]